MRRYLRRSGRGKDRPRGRGLVASASGVLAVALVAAACGGPPAGGGDGVASATGSGAASKTSKSSATDKDPHQAGLDFARCMREHGVDMPDPEPDGGFLHVEAGPDAGGGGLAKGPPAGFEEADKACRHFLDDLVRDGGGPADPKEQDRALAFARCMREHGVNMGDPDFSQGGIRVEIGADGVDPGSEVFKEAQKACGSRFGPAGKKPGTAVARARS